MDEQKVSLSSMSATTASILQKLMVTHFVMMKNVVVIQLRKVMMVLRNFESKMIFCCKKDYKNTKLKTIVVLKQLYKH